MLNYKDLDPRKKAFVFKYRENFDRLYYTARLPLKLLLFSNVLNLLQEINLKPEPDVLTYILNEHKLSRKDVLILGASETDSEFAVSCGVDFLNITEFM